MSNSTRFLNGGRGLGVIDPATATTVISTAVSFISQFGKDEVPNYPIKSINTLNSLRASIIEHVGVLPPTSVTQAKEMLQKAIARQAYEDSIGHGYGDGVGWDTLQMMYDETILALKNYIASGGTTAVQQPGSGTVQTTLPAAYPTTPTSNFESFIRNNPLVVAGAAAVIIYFVTRKKRR